MTKRILAAAAVAAALALVAWQGFSDGREHERAEPAPGSAG